MKFGEIIYMSYLVRLFPIPHDLRAKCEKDAIRVLQNRARAEGGRVGDIKWEWPKSEDEGQLLPGIPYPVWLIMASAPLLPPETAES